MAGNPTYKMQWFSVNGCNVFADERFIGMIYETGKRFEAQQQDGVRLGLRSSLGAALDVVIEADRLPPHQRRNSGHDMETR